MSSLFNLKDLLRIAIKREQKSYRIYNEIIKNTCSTEVKTFLQVLVKEKKKHTTFYEKMLADIAEKNKVEISNCADDEAYMDELTKIKPLPADEIADIDAIILYVINLDKDTLEFFKQLKDHVCPELHDIIDKACAEETRHFLVDAVSAVQYAIKREKNSLLLYACLQNYVKSEQQSAINLLIKEVGGHIEELLKIKSSLNKDK